MMSHKSSDLPNQNFSPTYHCPKISLHWPFGYKNKFCGGFFVCLFDHTKNGDCPRWRSTSETHRNIETMQPKDKLSETAF